MAVGAARSLGLKRYAIRRTVIPTQVLPLALPPLRKLFIGLFKEIPLLAAIIVIDVFVTANGIADRAIRYNEPSTSVSVIFLGVSLIAAGGLHRPEARFLRPGR